MEVRAMFMPFETYNAFSLAMRIFDINTLANNQREKFLQCYTKVI